MPFYAKRGSRRAAASKIHGTVFNGWVGRAQFMLKALVTHRGVLAGFHWLELPGFSDRVESWLSGEPPHTPAAESFRSLTFLSIYTVL